jgi:hypothetical protein
MNKALKYFLIAAVLMALIGAGIGYYLYNAPVPGIENRKADFTLSSDALFSEFESDEAAANQKYIDKVIEVSGNIGEVSTDEKGSTVLILREAGAFNGVLCTLEDSQKEKASTLKKGDAVRLKGACTGMLMDVVLNKCVLVQ